MLKWFIIYYENKIVVYFILNKSYIMCKSVKLLKLYLKVQVNIYNIVIKLIANKMVCFKALIFIFFVWENLTIGV